MRPTLLLRATHARTPSIKFLGKRSYPKQVDHTPQPHPASPTHELPQSFASYRSKVQSHGPLGGQQSAPFISGSSASSSLAYGAIGGKSGRELGSVQPKQGEYFDVTELPKRFQRRAYTEDEMNAITSGGATMW